MKIFSNPLIMALALWPIIAAAQGDPLNPESAVPPTQYQSGFSDYQKYREVSVDQWKTLNENAGKNSMMMEGMDMKTPESSSEPSSAPSTPPHADHHMH